MTKRLCLNMIVKNESAIIERLLISVAPHIDCYVICDTGSTDNTVEIIRSFFDSRSIPGDIVHTTFEDFEQARNYALNAARDGVQVFDYLLLCDADMELVVERPEFRDELGDLPYLVFQQQVNAGVVYTNVRLLPRDLPARYVGVTHEHLAVGSSPRPIFDGIRFVDHEQGASRGEKLDRDIRLLKSGLQAEPDNSRYVFYLANSYHDSGEPAEAMTWYRRRMEMGGFEEEIFISSYRIGRCLQQLGREAEMIENDLLTFDMFPHRAEPLHQLAFYYASKGRHRLAVMIAEAALAVPMPDEGLFVESEVYTWRLLDIVAVNKYWLGGYDECAEITRRLLDVAPESEHDRMNANIKYCEDALQRSNTS